MLTEEQWKRIQPEGANRRPKLKKNMIRVSPGLELLGKSRHQIQAGVGVGIATTVYVIRGAKQSKLGWRDEEAPGSTKTQPEGDMMRIKISKTEADPPPGAKRSGGQTQEQTDKKLW